MQSAGWPERPLLVVVSGAPGSGKTTLAGRISEELRLPLLAKDRIKEALGDALGMPPDVSGSERLGRAAYAAMFALAAETLVAGQGVIVESNFRRGSSEREIRGIGARPDNVRLVHCSAAPGVVTDRYRSRFAAGKRHPVHLDEARVDALEEDLASGRYEPIALGCPTLVVDTTAGYHPDLDAIVAFVRGRGAKPT